ncbi:MAG: hypothetical protein ACU0CO_05155 [Shimia sp.]
MEERSDDIGQGVTPDTSPDTGPDTSLGTDPDTGSPGCGARR